MHILFDHLNNQNTRISQLLSAVFTNSVQMRKIREILNSAYQYAQLYTLCAPNVCSINLYSVCRYYSRFYNFAKNT